MGDIAEQVIFPAKTKIVSKNNRKVTETRAVQLTQWLTKVRARVLIASCHYELCGERQDCKALDGGSSRILLVLLHVAVRLQLLMGGGPVLCTLACADVRSRAPMPRRRCVNHGLHTPRVVRGANATAKY